MQDTPICSCDIVNGLDTIVHDVKDPTIPTYIGATCGVHDAHCYLECLNVAVKDFLTQKIRNKMCRTKYKNKAVFKGGIPQGVQLSAIFQVSSCGRIQRYNFHNTLCCTKSKVTFRYFRYHGELCQ